MFNVFTSVLYIQLRTNCCYYLNKRNFQIGLTGEKTFVVNQARYQ